MEEKIKVFDFTKDNLDDRYIFNDYFALNYKNRKDIKLMKFPIIKSV